MGIQRGPLREKANPAAMRRDVVHPLGVNENLAVVRFIQPSD
jgi:hypothetical protein